MRLFTHFRHANYFLIIISNFSCFTQLLHINFLDSSFLILSQGWILKLGSQVSNQMRLYSNLLLISFGTNFCSWQYKKLVIVMQVLGFLLLAVPAMSTQIFINMRGFPHKLWNIHVMHSYQMMIGWFGTNFNHNLSKIYIIIVYELLEGST